MRLTSKVLAIAFSALMIASVLPAHAQISSTQKRSSAAVGINLMGAPVPAPLLNAQHVFISYELGDVTAFPSSYSGGPERAYGEFYMGMKAWGRYQLVSDPRDADLIFTVRFVETPAIPAPQIRIGVVDAHTGTPLWGFAEQVNFAFRKKNRDADFSDTVQQLVSDVQTLVTQAQSTPQP